MSAHHASNSTPSGIEKKGGYSGSRPASSMPPPPKLPSASIKPRRDAQRPSHNR